MIQVKVLRGFLILYEREPDPAGGRPEEKQLARLTIEEADSLCSAIKSKIPEAVQGELEASDALLMCARGELERAKRSVAALETKISDLNARRRAIQR